MIWAFNARRASLSEALHIVAKLPPANAHNNISSSSSSNDDLPIATSTLKQQMDMNL
jgi:antitoxin component of MazEF toxin-antitoxin module